MIPNEYLIPCDSEILKSQNQTLSVTSLIP